MLKLQFRLHLIMLQRSFVKWTKRLKNQILPWATKKNGDQSGTPRAGLDEDDDGGVILSLFHGFHKSSILSHDLVLWNCPGNFVIRYMIHTNYIYSISRKYLKEIYCASCAHAREGFCALSARWSSLEIFKYSGCHYYVVLFGDILSICIIKLLY